MAFQAVDIDNIRESFAAANSATITLGGAIANSRAFSSKITSGNTFWGVARNGAEISVGIFTYTSGSPGTIAQTSVFYSSNSNNAVTFSSGTGEVYIDLPSHVADALNLVAITVTSAATMDIGAVDGKFITSNGSTGPVTSFGTSTNKERVVKWSGQTITHNGTSVNMLGATNYVTTSGDYSLMKSDASGNWFEIFRSYGAIVPFDRRAPGAIGGTTPSTGAFTTLTASSTINSATIDENAWSSFTPTVGVTGGSNPGSSSASCRHRRLFGRTIVARFRVTLTTVAPAASPNHPTVTLPVNADTTVPVQTIYGRESGTTGKGIAGAINSSTVAFVAFDDAASVFTGGNGTLVDFTMTYEAAS